MDKPGLDIEEKFKLIHSVGEECVTEPELRNLLTKKPNFNLYDGFEPSGRMHIAQGVFKAMNVNKCTKAGGTFIFWVADWFALMNDKMGGDLEKIQTVGKYLIEVWKAAGMDMTQVKFLWSSSEIVNNAEAYWGTALDITRQFTIARIMKCCTIMGRGEDNLTAAQILYPIMQCTDVFFLKADICQLGVDQRKVNMLARDYCEASKRKFKPIILSHHMLYGLKKGQAKMSKSDPDSAIFMEDTAEDVERKIMAAYCPIKPEPVEEKDKEEKEKMQLKNDPLGNPCLDYIEHIIFCVPDAIFKVGETEYKSFEAVKNDFLSEKIPELDLKKALITALNQLIEPVRKHFSEGEPKALLALIKSYSKDAVASPLKRLQATEFGKPHVIFSPLACANWKLDVLLTLVRALHAIPQGAETILWVRDWSSFVENACGGQLKVIQASFTVLVEVLKTVVPDLMKNVRVIFQSQAILKDPSNYWISVINVGRTLKLSKVQALEPSNIYVGFIISSLMHVGDILGTNPATIISTEKDVARHKLAIEYYKLANITTLNMPEITVIDSVNGQLRVPTEGFDDPDLDIFVLDSAPDVGRKLKKAFCAPNNIEYCPPLALAEVLMTCLGMQVDIKVEGGESKQFTQYQELKKAFSEGMHPGDLKPGINPIIEAFMQKFRPQLNVEPSKKAVVDLRNAIKAAAKKK